MRLDKEIKSSVESIVRSYVKDSDNPIDNHSLIEFAEYIHIEYQDSMSLDEILDIIEKVLAEKR
jgi:hypothetical protein